MSLRVLRSTVAAAVLGSVFLVACSSSGQADSGSTSGSASRTDGVLRIATHNINFANKDLSLVIDAVLGSGADVIAFQEMTHVSEPYLARKLKSAFPHTTLLKAKDRERPLRLGLISKFPILQWEYTEPKYGLHGTYCAVLEVDKKKVQVVNIHLHPPLPCSIHGPLHFVRLLRKAERIHKAEIERIHRRLIPGIPTIILGDFNSFSVFKAPTYLRDNGFTDSFASVHEEADRHRTWEWQTRYGKVSARIDYIFHDASFKTLGSRIIRNGSSDHSLLVSELRFVEKPE
jgi:endonuclease/exonuclease/phosphatase family metal-dependent hydrolase